MYRMWMMFDPRRVLVANVAFLAVLALFIHFILLSSAKYNWIDGAHSMPAANHQAALPAQRK